MYQAVFEKYEPKYISEEIAASIAIPIGKNKGILISDHVPYQDRRISLIKNEIRTKFMSHIENYNKE